MVSRKISECAAAIRFGRSDYRQRLNESKRLAHFSLVPSILHQLHYYEPGHGRQLWEGSEPFQRRLVTALNVYQYIGIQQVRNGYSRTRSSA